MPEIKLYPRNPVRAFLGMIGVVITFMFWSSVIILRRLLFMPSSIDSYCIKKCSVRVMWWLELTYRLENAEIYDPKEPAVVIANHSSLIDIPLTYMAVSSNLRMLAKREVFWVPFMGWAMWASHAIAINRGHRDSAKKAKATLSLRLKQGYQIFLAPEGTRSKTGCLLPFKTGAFRIAAEHRIPIYVLALYKPWEVLPKGDLYSPVKGEMVCRFLGKIDPMLNKDSAKTHEALLAEARKLYLQHGFKEC